jgi:hypothetical protein
MMLMVKVVVHEVVKVVVMVRGEELRGKDHTAGTRWRGCVMVLVVEEVVMMVSTSLMTAAVRRRLLKHIHYDEIFLGDSGFFGGGRSLCLKHKIRPG